MKEADLVRALVLPKVLKSDYVDQEGEKREPPQEQQQPEKGTATSSSSSPSIESLAQIEQQTDELISEVNYLFDTLKGNLSETVFFFKLADVEKDSQVGKKNFVLIKFLGFNFFRL